MQYGCGLTAPDEWENYDVSPTLRIQNVPLLGSIFSSVLNVRFPKNVKYGDIITGLPHTQNSCAGIYCSHVLEHLSLSDFRIAIRNTYSLLAKDGIFRCVVPDLEAYARSYIESLERGDNQASFKFLEESLLGLKNRRRGFKALVVNAYGNANHLWMWDYASLSDELAKAGFRDIRRCKFNDSLDGMFKVVEESGRFVRAVAIECKK